MSLMDFLNEQAVSCDVKAQTKQEVVQELVDLLVKAGTIKERDAEKLVQILMAREALGSTGIGQGVAIPHGKSNVVRQLVGAFGISHQGVNFDSLDGEMAQIFFLLLAPEDSAGPHLKALARISRLLKDRFFRESLKEAKDEKQVVKVIQQEDEKNL